MKFLLILMTLMSLQAHAVLNEKGNGGDVYTCDGKIRFLDSAHMKDQRMYTNRKFKNVEEFNNAFITKLFAVVPNLASEYIDFVKSYEEGRSDGYLYNKWAFRITWVSGIPFELHDENLRVQKPKVCSDKRQVVYREVLQPKTHPNTKVIRYYFNESIVDELKKNDDELSWLLVHEWLWNYGIKNAQDIRFLNAYFHSEDFFDHVEDEVIDELTINNFSINSLIKNEAYQILIRDYLSKKASMLEKIEKLNQLRRNIHSKLDKNEIEKFNSIYEDFSYWYRNYTIIYQNGYVTRKANPFVILNYSYGPYRNEARQITKSYNELSKYYNGEFKKYWR